MRNEQVVARSGLLQRLRRFRMTAGATLRHIVGMPDYTGYLAHMAERHPGSAVLSEREHFEEHIQARYGNGVSRCC